MNLRYLNAQQRKALSILAFHMAMADGIVTDSENAMMADIKAELGVDEEITPMELMERPSLEVFDNPRAKATALLQLLTLAFVDNKFPSSESEVVAELSAELGIEGTELERFKDWARNNVDLRMGFDRLLDGMDD